MGVIIMPNSAICDLRSNKIFYMRIIKPEKSVNPVAFLPKNLD